MATFANTVDQSKEVNKETFSNYRKRMKIALKANAIHRKRAIQAVSKVTLN